MNADKRRWEMEMDSPIGRSYHYWVAHFSGKEVLPLSESASICVHLRFELNRSG
jgi:hypothetical protein